jgi:hypothetical protein
MGMRRAKRHALRRIGMQIRREDPLLAAMLTDDNDAPTEGRHRGYGKARRRQAGDAAQRRFSDTPFIMF